MEKLLIEFPWHSRRIVFMVLMIVGCASTACGGLNQTPSGSVNTFMNQSLPKDAQIIRDETNDTITFLIGRNLSSAIESEACFRQFQENNDAEAIAKAFINAYREEFRLIDPHSELMAASVVTDDLGLTHVKLRQAFHDIPVSASEVIVHLDRENHVYLVNGRYVPTPQDLNVQPGITPSDAEAAAAKHLGRDPADCPQCETTLVILPKAGSSPQLAFRMEALIRADEGWIYFIDAHSGLIIERQTSIRFGP